MQQRPAVGDPSDQDRIRWAPKLPVVMIARLYSADAEGLHDDTLVDDVGFRLLTRCADVVLVTDSLVVCPRCGTTFDVAWIGQPPDQLSVCPGCGWCVTSGDYHASFEHRDLNGIGARDAFAAFVREFPRLRTFSDKMLAIDRLINTVHTTGGLAARNLFEGRARQTIAALDAIARSTTTGSSLMAEVRRAHAAGEDDGSGLAGSDVAPRLDEN